jgi:Sec-independent protein secretion pathway component TatC
MYILAKFGIVSHTWLLKKWRWGILGAAVIAALVTPTGDVFHDSTKDLILMDCGLSVSGPIFFLYFVSIFMAWLGRRPKREVPISDVALDED